MVKNTNADYTGFVDNVKRTFSPKGKAILSAKIKNGIVYSCIEDDKLIFIPLMSIRTGQKVVMVDNKDAFDMPSNSPVCLTYPIGKRKIGSVKQLLSYLRSQKGMFDSMSNQWHHKKFTKKDLASFARSHKLSK